MEKVTLEIAGQRREAWANAPAIENLTRPEKTPKLESPLLFISTDEKRELLKIESKVFVGSMRITLEKFTPKQVQP